eukprot:365213-Chlamydomonas_euryale.AAC.1
METANRISSAHFVSCHTFRIWGSAVLPSETKLCLYNCTVVTHLTYRGPAWTLSSLVIDRLEVVQNCFLRQSKGIQFFLGCIISTADLNKFHLVTVPMAFTLARQRASFMAS